MIEGNKYNYGLIWILGDMFESFILRCFVWNIREYFYRDNVCLI